MWVLGDDCQVTEAGASNFFVVVKNTETGRPELLTAPLTDKIILKGVTRQSVLDLARSRLTKELTVVERKFTMYELEKAWDEGRVLEAFVSGTAVSMTVTPNEEKLTCCSSSSLLFLLSILEAEIQTFP